MESTRAAKKCDGFLESSCESDSAANLYTVDSAVSPVHFTGAGNCGTANTSQLACSSHHHVCVVISIPLWALQDCKFCNVKSERYHFAPGER